MKTINEKGDSPDATSEAVVKLRSLTKYFIEGKGQRVVLDHLDCDFKTASFTVILGKSGSGKSTLLNLISGIEKPTGGDIFVDGHEINNLKDRERTLFRRDHIGFIFQFFNLIPTLTVLENITLPQELAGLSSKDVAKKARAYLETVGLADREKAFPDTLSGGEQQRVAIARALVHDPLLILADEPTGNLDEETGAAVLSMLLNLTNKEGRTLIMATHNTEIAAQADRVLTLQDGRFLTDS